VRSPTPILLSFYGLSNGTKNLFFGKLAYSPTDDLSFQKYNWFKNFKTILALYHTKAIEMEEFEMVFDHGVVKGKTDVSGSFWCEVDLNELQSKLISCTLVKSGKDVKLTEDLYPNTIHNIDTHTIVISDLDDTLIHSFIRNKLRQIRTLLFTSVEKRKAVDDMLKLIRRLALSGATPFYLSNSEQNLYPMLFRFLTLNQFPVGPIFLKQYTRFQHLLAKRLLRKKNPHKLNTLKRIMELFPNKKYILIGDNTQHDLSIYLSIAEKHAEKIRYIIIRKVYSRTEDNSIIDEARKTLQVNNIGLHYADNFPEDLPLNF
jgi:phosphatidate phosphatase APP1